CVFAGRGFDRAASAIESLLEQRTTLNMTKRAVAVAAVGAVSFAGAAAVTAHSHPFGLSAYVPLVGGTAGGADLGLNRQFWGFTTETAAREYLDRAAPPRATVFIHDTAWDSW